jgi:hypothetical protein
MNEPEKNTEETEVEANPAEATSESVEATVVAADETVSTDDLEKKDNEEEVAAEEEKEVSTIEVVTEEETPVSSNDKKSPIVMIMGYVACAKKSILARKYTISAVVLVIVALIGLTYIMEKQGRINTGIFDGIEKLVTGHKAVAIVNGQKITKNELDTSVAQISAGAVAQGMDSANEEMKLQIRGQALDMLVNTELLMQEAKERGIVVTEEEVEQRIGKLREDIGGEEVLATRMAEFGITEKILRRDVKNELTVKALLDQVFVEKGITITDEEVAAFYEQAGGKKAGLPAIEEVSEQIKAQIKSTKEQEQVTALIEELRGEAAIELR